MKQQFANTREEVISILLSDDSEIDIDTTLDALFLVAIDKACCGHHFTNISGPNGCWAIGYDNLEIPFFVNETELIYDTTS